MWSDNDAAYEKYGVGTLEAEIFDRKGNLLHEARISLPEELKQKVSELDKLFLGSMDWNDPAGDSPWNQDQWDSFHQQTKELWKKISGELGDDFEIIYKQP